MIQDWAKLCLALSMTHTDTSTRISIHNLNHSDTSKHTQIQNTGLSA